MWPSTSDPVARLSLAAYGVWVAACAGAAPVLWWALSPPAPASWALGNEGERSGGGDGRPSLTGSPTPLDVAAFNVRLWNPPPEPVADTSTPAPSPPPPPPPAGPMPVLLAIMREGGAATAAAIYDSAQDRVIVARPGDAIMGRHVVRITAASVELRAGAAITTITLEPESGTR